MSRRRTKDPQKRLLVFTENYRVRPVASSYLIDLCNSVGGLYDELILACNPSGLPLGISSRLSTPSTVIDDVGIITAERIHHDIKGASWLMKRDRIADLLWRRATIWGEYVFARNVGVCRRLIRKVRPTAVLAYNGGYPAGRSVLAMVVAARREGLPVALSVVSVPSERPEGQLAAWETRMDGLVGESADVFLVNAHAISDSLCELRGLPREKMRVIHNALPDVPRIVVPKTGASLRIGCVARIDRLKGFAYLVEAFARLVGDGLDAELVLAGDGPERSAVEQQIDDLGIGDRVTMVGHYTDDINELIAPFDIYAFPSLWEGLPYSVLEAMRAGLPIVATDVGGVSEAIIDGETGILIPPGSTEAMAEALGRLAHDPELRVRLGAAARDKFLESFSSEVMQRQIGEVFLSAGLARSRE